MKKIWEFLKIVGLTWIMLAAVLASMLTLANLLMPPTESILIRHPIQELPL